jgi:hypothetical protein
MPLERSRLDGLTVLHLQITDRSGLHSPEVGRTDALGATSLLGMTNETHPLLSESNLRRILSAATPLPEGLAELIQAPRVGDPQPGEIWRIGRDEALLAWVRRVFDDGMADVIPVVLDVEQADEETVLIPAHATPIATELAAMVALRTHVDSGVFLNRICALDIQRDVTEVMAAAREGRHPSSVPVGPPIHDDADQRIQYRQAIRLLLAGVRDLSTRG